MTPTNHPAGMSLVQLVHPAEGRSVAVVQGNLLVLISGMRSVYELALAAIDRGQKLTEFISGHFSGQLLDYDSVYHQQSDWKILPAFDHPGHPADCIVSGTGLTHKNSALNRQMMHHTTDKVTDSMKIYQWGLEGGRPVPGVVGVQPEWFYKGTGAILRGHGGHLEIPGFANDGGEEAEVAAVYVVDKMGQPWRIGFTIGNEFSDHVMEKKNYLYLAPSKLRHCAIGPELVIDMAFNDLAGNVSVERQGNLLWSTKLHSGEHHMAHSLSNLEHHHFKYPQHRVPLQAHVHFFGADAFSFGAGIQLQDGDITIIQWKGMGKALQNTIRFVDGEDSLQQIAVCK